MFFVICQSLKVIWTFEMIFRYFSIFLLTTLSVHSSSVQRNGGSASTYPPSECGIANVTIYNRIIGGGETEPGEWPWMAYVKHTSMFCGGALVDSTHVLTAAHCVTSNVKSMEIKLGDFNPRDGIQEIKRKVVKAVTHPDYKVYWDLPDGPSINDLAIVTLDQPVPFSKTISPICLPERYQSYSGKIATTIGYGAIGPDGPNSDILRVMSGPIWNNNACQARHDRAPVLDSHICFGDHGRASCHGDSGGPLMINENGRWYHIGVTGWVREACNVDWCGQDLCDQKLCGETVCDTTYPTVFARVTNYLPWILENLKA